MNIVQTTYCLALLDVGTINRSSLSFFIIYFSLAYFSIVWALFFNSPNSNRVSFIFFANCPSLVSRSLNFFHLLTSELISFGSKKNIQAKKKLPARRYLFFSRESFPKPPVFFTAAPGNSVFSRLSSIFERGILLHTRLLKL